jgi:23S rRNA pseudouridine2605 synthase
MRLNKYIAQATGLSRRAADEAITQGRVLINAKMPVLGQAVAVEDVVTLDGATITPSTTSTTIMLHKPIGYVCSRDGQGNRTVYDLLPTTLHHLKPVGRLDKNSSGLLLLTDDGNLAHRMTHPSFRKTKVYWVALDTPLTNKDIAQIGTGVHIGDAHPSSFLIQPLGSEHTATNTRGATYEVRLSEGRNRQIRRTFEALDRRVIKLHRLQFGDYTLEGLKPGKYRAMV